MKTLNTNLTNLNNTLDSKASSSHTHSYISLTDKPTIPVAVAVKGNAESSYRTGNVNITPANIGLGNVNNTADSAKSVNYATSAGSANAVAWNNVTGKPSTYTPASHTHSYLPLSGGTVTGNLGVNGTIMANGNNIEGSGTLCIRSASSPVNTATGYGLVVTNYDATSFKQVEASAFAIQSSKKTKENIKNITDEEANKLLEVKTVSFDYKENFGGYKNQFGVIAEQVIDILPSVVSVPDNYNEDDFDESKGINQPILSVDYSKFVPFLIKMIQIQQIKINELEERLNNLS